MLQSQSNPEAHLAFEFIEQLSQCSVPGLMRELRDTLLAMDEPERLIRGMCYLLADDALEEAEQSLRQALEEAAREIRADNRDTARRWAKWLVGHGVCKLVLGEQYGLVSGASWRMHEVLHSCNLQ